MPLPRADYDPSEVAVSWKMLVAAGHGVTFASPDGSAPATDPVMLSGIGLDPWSRVPGLRRVKLLGLLLRADRRGRAAHCELVDSGALRSPLRYDAIESGAFDALLLAGGHASGMREYLESTVLQEAVAAFFDAGKPVAAICHGVVLAARSVSRATGHSVLHGRRTTALTWTLERAAWRVARRTRWWDRNYYRTYAEQRGEPEGFRSVQAEVTRALARSEDFLDVAAGAADEFRKGSGLFRDSPDDARPAFVVRDANYVSARWPGDVHAFARTFAEVLEDHSRADAKAGLQARSE
jgi:putative intracellular protease/amidase